ncbi:MAG TPA: hypothetical protein VGU64_04130 [Terriglobales bacterium]|nr:hypothetical protein [Terriglobales bacterium]
MKNIFELLVKLLVKQHPNYSDFMVRADLAWVIARKTASERKVYTAAYKEKLSPMSLLGRSFVAHER